MSQRTDLDTPLAYADDGTGTTLETVTGDRMYGQRIQRLAFMHADGLYHRPNIGGGMKSSQNKPPHPGLLQQQLNRFGRFMDRLPFIVEQRVRMKHDPKTSATAITVEAKTDDGDLVIRDIEF